MLHGRSQPLRSYKPYGKRHNYRRSSMWRAVRHQYRKRGRRNACRSFKHRRARSDVDREHRTISIARLYCPNSSETVVVTVVRRNIQMFVIRRIITVAQVQIPERYCDCEPSASNDRNFQLHRTVTNLSATTVSWTATLAPVPSAIRQRYRYLYAGCSGRYPCSLLNSQFRGLRSARIQVIAVQPPTITVTCGFDEYHYGANFQLHRHGDEPQPTSVNCPPYSDHSRYPSHTAPIRQPFREPVVVYACSRKFRHLRFAIIN